jgi:cardiolipin synthase A/B
MSISNPKAAFEYTEQNKVQLIRGGKPYFDQLLQMINSAKESLHLQTYIYDDDETGRLVAEALKSAVKRNVKVYLIADGYASQSLSKSFIGELRDAGVHVKLFEPLLKSKFFYFGRRMHHKVTVADTMYAMVGGVNISNRYNDMPGTPAWLDFALHVEGEIARELCVLCWKTWFGFSTKMKITPCEEKQIVYDTKPGESSPVRMRRQDWVRRKLDISRTYVEMLRTSKTQVTILCSYFLPGKLIRRLMRAATKRGVKIRVITAGRSDVMMSKFAERWLYDWLLRHNIELYEYQKNILHGKLAVCDSSWMTVGSYNVNDISAYATLELNLDVKDDSVAQKTEKMLEQIITDDCIRITEEHHEQTRNIIKQFVRWFSYNFIRFVFFLFTFYFHQRK